MKIIRKNSCKYGIQKIGKKCHRIVKILKEYEYEQEAISDLMKLLDGEITERNLTGSSFEQEAEAGKLGCRINCLEAVLEGIRNDLVQAICDSDKLEKAAREIVKQINEILGE